MGYLNNPEQIQREVVRSLGSAGTLPEADSLITDAAPDQTALSGSDYLRIRQVSGTKRSTLTKFAEWLYTVFGTAARKDVQVNVGDITLGRLITMGGGGLLAGGSDVVGMATVDANNALANGWYTCAADCANIPVADQGTICCAGLASSQVSQLFFHHSTGIVYTRRRYGAANTWNAWSRVLANDKLIGAVTQNSGVPTGALVEYKSAGVSGSNTFSETWKWSCGMMICRGRYDSASLPANQISVSGPPALTDTFVGDYTPLATATPLTNSDVYGVVYCSISNGTTFTPVIRNGSVAQAFRVSWTATGRWF